MLSEERPLSTTLDPSNVGESALDDVSPVLTGSTQKKTGLGGLIRPRQVLTVGLLGLIAWMSLDTVSTWVFQQWVPSIIPLEAIQADLKKQLGQATQLQPQWETFSIQPTLTRGIRLSLSRIRFQDNPDILKKWGVYIPVPQPFKTPLAQTVPMQTQSAKALIEVADFHLYLNYLPLLTRQHLEIGRVELNGVRLRGGQGGVLNHYFPVVYDPAYFKKYTQKPAMPTYLKRATVALYDVNLQQAAPPQMLPVKGKKISLTGKITVKDALPPADNLPAILAQERVGIHVDQVEISNLISNKPVKAHVSGSWGVLDTNHGLLDPAYRLWNRGFQLDAKASAMGDDPDKALAKQWQLSDLQEANALIKPSDAWNTLLGEQIRLEIRSPEASKKAFGIALPVSKLALKNQSLMLKDGFFRDWHLTVARLDLAIITDTLQAADQVLGRKISPDLRSLELKGRIGADVTGGIKGPNIVKDPIREMTLTTRQGKVDLDNITLTQRVILQRPAKQQAENNFKRSNIIRRIPFLENLKGRITLSQNQADFSNLSLLLAGSPLNLAGRWNIDTNGFEARLKGQRLVLSQLMLSLGQAMSFAENYQPGSITPEAKQIMAQWRQGDLKIGGLLNFDLAFAGNPKKMDYTGTASLQDGQLIDTKSTMSVDALNADIAIDQKIHLITLKARILESPFSAQGEADKEFKTYRLALNAEKLELHRLFTVLKKKIASANLNAEQKQSVAALNDVSGQADLALKIDSTQQWQGKLQMRQLAIMPRHPLATGGRVEPVRFNQLDLNFLGKQAKLIPTQGHWGPIPLNVKASAILPVAGQALNYQANIDTGAMPVSMFRDHPAFFQSLLPNDLYYPHVWNTTGSLTLSSNIRQGPNQKEPQLDGALSFLNAGASGRDSDFPLYALNGALRWQLLPGRPFNLESDQLQFRYGNSPVQVRVVDRGTGPNLVVKGAISPLTVNHYLTASQSPHAPYEEVPFRAQVQKRPSPQLPPEVYIGRLFLDLNQLLTDTTQATPATPLVSVPPASIVTVTEPPEKKILQQPLMSQVNNPLPVGRQPIAGQARIPIASVANPQQAGQAEQVAESFRRNQQERIAKLLENSNIAELTTAISDKMMQDQLSPQDSTASQRRQQRKKTAYFLGEFGFNAKPPISSKYPLKFPAVQIYPSQLHLSDHGDIWLAGFLAHLPAAFDFNKAHGQVRLMTSPELDLKGISEQFRSDIFKDADGKVAADITLNLDPTQPRAFRRVLNGSLTTDGIRLPQFLVEDLTGGVTFERHQALIDFPSVRFQGASLSAKATAPQVMKFPILLSDVDIHGSLLNIPGVQQFNEEVVSQVIVKNVVRRFTRPWQEGDAVVPVEIRDGNISIEEVVYDNILLENVKGKLSVFSNSFVQLSDAEVKLAGGQLTGYLQMNPFENNFVDVDMAVSNVQANALTRALLGVSNQVFGELSGTIRYQTQGNTDDEMLQNAIGTVSIDIDNGRLPALSQVETLLTAANILRGGVLGLNFNNLLRAVIPFRSQYFAKLSGDLRVADKKLHTDNLLSDGENLDLVLQGTVTMDDGMADMVVNGTMAQDVAGKLGSVGQLSVGRLLKYIPILGFNLFDKNNQSIRDADPGLIYLIPGLGYVPGLGGPARDVNRFRILMQGPPQDQASIKSFSWVKSDGQQLEDPSKPPKKEDTQK